MAASFCPHCMSILRGEAEQCPQCGGDARARNADGYLPVGTVLADPATGQLYQLGAAKGAGGFGITYIGRENGTDRLVAVKEYYPIRCQPSRTPDGFLRPPTRDQSAYEHGIKSLLQEAETLKKVSRIPSVVKVRCAFRANGTAYMVMDYLKGTTLQRAVEKHGPMGFDELMEKLLPMVEDLAMVHDAGVLHRDIAPDNIMLTPEGRCVLMDFGCARFMEDGRSMTVVLKAGFAPLEQYTSHGQKAYTDVYALCATIYYCVTGQVPPDSPSRLTAASDGQPDPLKPPSALGARISPKDEQVLLWGMGLQPNVRPQTVRKFLARLKGNAPIPDPPGWTEKVLEFLKKNKLLLAIAAAVLLALLLFR